MSMDTVWRAIALKDWEASIANIYHTTKEFPEVLAWSDSHEELKDYLEKVCDLLTLNIPWENTKDEGRE